MKAIKRTSGKYENQRYKCSILAFIERRTNTMKIIQEEKLEEEKLEEEKLEAGKLEVNVNEIDNAGQYQNNVLESVCLSLPQEQRTKKSGDLFSWPALWGRLT